MRAWVYLGVCVFAAISLIVLFNAEPVLDRVSEFQRLRDRLGSVDVSDGIQVDEADLIASEYSDLVLGPIAACSGTTAPTLADGVWKAEILFGFGGEPTGTWITVDPVRGGVGSPGKRSYRHFDSFRRARLLTAVIRGR
jgi:hypothetical protein